MNVSRLRRRVGYLRWLASAEGPRESPYLKRLRLPSLSAVLVGRANVFLVPSHPIKERIVRRYAETYGLHTLIETGTFKGDMIAKVAPFFDRCITIELSADLWRQAQARFRDDPKISCLNGDSGELIRSVAQEVDEPSVFWLDAHYSGGVTAQSRDPLLEELAAVFKRGRRDVILIDDARCHDLAPIAAMIPATHAMLVRNDVIRITPGTASSAIDQSLLPSNPRLPQ